MRWAATPSGVNSASGMLAALGACPAAGHFPASTNVGINEVSTIATAYAVSGFATDATHISSSGTTLAATDIANAFANVSNLEGLSTGAALDTTPAGNGTVPSNVIDTLADILATCVNASDAAPAPCASLFGYALNNASTPAAPTETATAAINIAHNPGNNVSSLFKLITGIAGPFPGLRVAPNDFTIAINFSASLGVEPNDLAIDSGGDVWITDTANNRIVELSPLGAVKSGNGYIAGGDILFPFIIAIDTSGNAWVANYINPNSTVTELTSSGALAAGTGNFTGNGLSIPTGLAIDGNNNVWVANNLTASVTEISNTGTTPTVNNYPVPYTLGMAIDTADHPWISCSGTSLQSGLLFEELSTSGSIINSAPGRGGTDLDVPKDIAFDASGDAWFVDPYTTNVIEEASTGGYPPLSGYFGYAQGAFTGPTGIAVDGGGNVWVSDYLGAQIVELSQAGNVISPAGGFTSNTAIVGPFSVVPDGSGNLWTISWGSLNVVEFIGLSTPVVTPLAYGVKTSSLGSRP
jgi:streptogramin lyase